MSQIVLDFPQAVIEVQCVLRSLVSIAMLIQSHEKGYSRRRYAALGC